MIPIWLGEMKHGAGRREGGREEESELTMELILRVIASQLDCRMDALSLSLLCEREIKTERIVEETKS